MFDTLIPWSSDTCFNTNLFPMLTLNSLFCNIASWPKAEQGMLSREGNLWGWWVKCSRRLREKSYWNLLVLQWFFPPLNCAPEEIGASTEIAQCFIYIPPPPNMHPRHSLNLWANRWCGEEGGRENNLHLNSWNKKRVLSHRPALLTCCLNPPEKQANTLSFLTSVSAVPNLWGVLS